MARNKLTDLNDHLFAQIERLSDEALSPEQIDSETKRAKAIVSVSGQIIKNSKITIDAMKLVASGNYGIKDMPETLGLKKAGE